MEETTLEAVPENIRPWGRYDILEDTETHKTKRITVKAGARLSYQRHAKRSEVWVVVGGRGTVTLDDRDREIAYGDVVSIPVGMKHRVAAGEDGPLVFVEVQTGTYFGEDDIERFSDDYGRADDASPGGP